MTVLQMSFFGAVMILAVIVIRALAVNRLPTVFLCLKIQIEEIPSI